MFKGLKSKLAEETKKLQNAVSQVAGDGIGGFSIGKNNSALSNSGENTPQQQGANSNPGFKLDESDTGVLVDIRSPGDQQSPIAPTPDSSMSSFFDAYTTNDPSVLADGEGTPARQRRDSTGSTGSVDSFFMPTASLSNTASNRLTTITSDLETDSESMAGSTFVAAASKEQISTVLSRLQGRAANYKDRYRQLAKIYNEVIRENEKIRTILTTTQDKALRRIQELREEKRMQEKAKRELEENISSKLSAKEQMIETLQNQIRTIKDGGAADEGDDKEQELVVHKDRVKKLEDLLSRCKDSMKAYKERIDSLSTENDSLKQKLDGLEHEEGNAAISDFVSDRVSSQYKADMQEAEEEWRKRLADSEERTAMAVAQTKHQMHAQLETKDQAIEALRQKARQAELAASAEMDELKEQLQRAQDTEKVLDEEKKDLVEQLSRAKQAAVQIVREEENAKRDQMESEWRNKLSESEKRMEAQLRQAEEDYQTRLAEKTNEYQAKLREYEEQSQLAIEERELQKSAVATKYDQRLDQLMAQIDQLKTEKLELESNSERQIEDLRSRMVELDSSNAQETEQSTIRIQSLEHQLTACKEQANQAERHFQEELRENTGRLEAIQQKLKAAEIEHEEAVREHQEELARVEEEWRARQYSQDHSDQGKIKEYLDIIDQLRREKLELETNSRTLVNSNSEYAREIEEMNEKISQLSGEAEVEDLEVRLKESEQGLERAMEERSEHLAQVETAKVEYGELLAELSSKEAHWRAAIEQADQYSAIIDQLRQEKLEVERSLERRLEEVQSQIVDMNCSHERELEESKLKVAQLSEEMEKKNDQLSSALKDLVNTEQLLIASEEGRKAAEEELEQRIGASEKRANEETDQVRAKLAQYEQDIGSLHTKHEMELAWKEEEWRLKQEQTIIQHEAVTDQLRQEKCNRERELESEVSRLQSQMGNLQGSRDEESEALRAELSRKEEQLKWQVDEMKKQSARHEQLIKMAKDEWAEKAKDYDERIAVLERNTAEELEVKMKEATGEHNEKVKQLCRDFQLEMSKKENEWQAELNTAYAKSEEDRHRAVREYQKEAKQLHQELQEKSKRLNELKAAYDLIEKEKDGEVERLKEHFGQEMSKLEEQMNDRMKQRMEDVEQKHKEELDGLTTEWTTERRCVPAGASPPADTAALSSALPASSVDNLEMQAQIVQGDVKQESAMYLKQRVRQLEAQIEAIKDKYRKEMLVKGSEPQADRSANGPASSRPRMDSVCLDGGSGVLFAEPTEAEYLRNILFRYMTERESLGKESVTLAKAIAAVLKFSNDQTHTVVAREEARSASNW